MQNLVQKLRVPKVQVSLILLVLFVTTMPHLPLGQAFYLLITCVGFTILSDLIFAYIRRRTLFMPHAAMVTGMILTLTIEPTASWHQILVICASAMALKNFLRISGKHIFNPAASGLLVGYLIFSLNPSWWGASGFSPNLLDIRNLLVLIPILAIFYVSGIRMKRYPLILSFLIVFPFLFTFATNSFQLQSIVAMIVSPGTLFYALLMVPEPMTTPIRRNRQVAFGIVVAVLNALFVYISLNNVLPPNVSIPDTSLLALLLGNLLFFKFR